MMMNPRIPPYPAMMCLPLQESSMAEQPPVVTTAPERPVTYQKTIGSTKRGKYKLVDSLGYTYNLKSTKAKNSHSVSGSAL